MMSRATTCVTTWGRLQGFLGMVVIIGLGGCGDDGSGGQTLTGADAVAGCNRLANASCATGERCGSEQTREECLVGVRVLGLDCRRAQSVGPALEDCLSILESVDCETPDLPSTCNDLVVIGPVPAALSSCFTPSAELDTCDAYCASLGESCDSNCDTFEDEHHASAGIEWTNAGVCPFVDEGSAIPSCDVSLLSSAEARCCCSE